MQLSNAPHPALPRLSIARPTLAISWFHLEHLLSAGSGTAAALKELSDIESGYAAQRIWRQIAQRVDDGYLLSDTLLDWPHVFDPVQVALVKAGEHRGELAQACHSCMRLLQWQSSVRARFTTVLIYPAFAVMVLLAVVAFLMIFIVPVMGRFLEANVSETPWHTDALLRASALLIEHGLVLSVVAGATIVSLFCLRFANERFLQLSDRQLLQIPLVGKIIQDVSLSRYGLTCSRLYGGGVALDDAMRISEHLIGNRALKHSLSVARLRIQEGVALSEALSAAPHLPRLFVRLLSAGESAGALQGALVQASVQQQQQTDHTLQRAEKLIGPILLMLIGSVVLWIVVSLFGPVYQSAIDTVLAS